MTALFHVPHRGVYRWARRAAWSAWFCGAGSVVLAWSQARWYVFHPPYLPLTALLIGLTLATLIAIACSGWQVMWGPDRCRAMLIGMAVLPPIGFWVYVGVTARLNWSERWVPNTVAMRMAKVMGATFMRLEADLMYRQRRESDRIVMFFDPRRSPFVERVDRPEEDLAAMEQHLARMEDLLGGSISDKVFWIRGPLLGSQLVSLHGLALGSAWSPEIVDSYRGDRHELAHAALDWYRTPASNPPYVLHEGWAMSQCGDSRVELAMAAARARTENGALSVRALFGPEWYFRDSGPVYAIGGAFVDYLIREYGALRFRDFYVQCTPATFESDCRAVFEIEFDMLEKNFWQDVEATALASTRQ